VYKIYINAYDSGTKSTALIETQAGFNIASTLKYHAADEHDATPSHYILRGKMHVSLIIHA